MNENTLLMTKAQTKQMLGKLPASCVVDAIEGIKPCASVNFARQVLLRLEESGIVSWQREAPQEITLTRLGETFLAGL
jgi:hypothetical protein